jgi:hypothetical protein
MNRRVSLTLDTDEIEALTRLRDMLDPTMPLASFAANVLCGAVDCELYGIDNQSQQLVHILIDWQPQGEPN